MYFVETAAALSEWQLATVHVGYIHTYYSKCRTLVGGKDYEALNATFTLPALTTQPPSRCVASIRALLDVEPEADESLLVVDSERKSQATVVIKNVG